MPKSQLSALSSADKEVIDLVSKANDKYLKYLEIMEQQAKLALTEDPPIQVERNWDYPLGLVIRKESHGILESVAT